MVSACGGSSAMFSPEIDANPGMFVDTHTQPTINQIKLKPGGLGEIRAAIRQHADCITRFLIVPPGTHDKCVVDRQTDDVIHALLPECRRHLVIARHMCR